MLRGIMMLPCVCAESAEHYVRVSEEHLKRSNMSLLDIAKEKGLA